MGEQPGQPHLNLSAGKDFLEKEIAETSTDAFLPYTQLWRMSLDQIECEMAQSRKVLRPVAPSDLTVIFAERHVEDPVASVLHLSMGAHCSRYRLGCGR